MDLSQVIADQLASREQETIAREATVADLEQQLVCARSTLDIVRAEAGQQMVDKVRSVFPSSTIFVSLQVNHIRALNERVLELEQQMQSAVDPMRLAAAESTIAELTAELARVKRVEQLLIKKKKKLEEACSDADAVEAQLREETTYWMLKCEDAERQLAADRQKMPAQQQKNRL